MPVRVCMRLDNVFTHDLRVRREAEALVEAGYEVTVVANQRPDGSLPVEEVRNGVRIRRIGKTSRVPYWSIVRPLLEERADVYHGHDIDSLFPCLAAARLGRRGAKVIYDSHELWSGQAPDKLHAKRRVLVRFEGQMLRAADGLITASPAYTEAIVARHSYHGCSHTVLNVPTYRTDEELEPYWRARESDAAVRVTTVSVFQHGRGAVPLIRSLAYLPDHFTVDLVGPVPQSDYEALMREAAKPFGERVRFVGVIPPENIVPQLAASHVSAVLIEPISESYQLTAPNKLFDSLMAGTPVVSSQGRVIADIVRTQRVGEVCDVADPADVARAIQAAYDGRLGYMRACRTAAARYNWENEREGLLDFYARLMGASAC